jgi:diaminopimelate decarboxylase
VPLWLKFYKNRIIPYERGVMNMPDKITDFIQIKNHKLWIEDHPVQDLAERYGTPMFIMSENNIRQNYRRFHHAFQSRYPSDVLVCVGMKANWGLACRKIIVEEGGGGDAFGLGELYVALLAGTPPDKIVMNGTNKSEEVLSAAIQSGVLINVDDLDEMERIANLVETNNKTANICIRIRMSLHALEGRRFVDPRYKPPGIDVSKWEREFKFGMEPDMVMDALKRALKNERIQLKGLHYHGGLPRRAGYSGEEAAELMDSIAELKQRFNWEPDVINLGGGFPKARYGLTNPHPLEEHAETITSTIKQKCEQFGLKLPGLILEPGRWCWDDAGTYVVRVGSIKEDQVLTQKKWVYADGSINEMGDPFDPFQSYHHVIIANNADAPDSGAVDICGPLCNAADILAAERPIPEVKQGDLIAFLNMGAYNEAFANQANAMPRSPTVLVNGKNVAVIRRRETLQDLFSRDRVPFWLL